jgi:hypothetical protein
LQELDIAQKLPEPMLDVAYRPERMFYIPDQP